MRLTNFRRNLKPGEQNIALQVFGSKLPPWKLIFICDGLGLADAPWTDHAMFFYESMVGDLAKQDLTSTGYYRNFGRIVDIFVHEMTHLWQYYRGDWVKTSSIGARIWEEVGASIKFDRKGRMIVEKDDAYEYTPGKPWKDYNVEEQATIVENWYSAGASQNDPLFPYVEKVIRTGGASWSTLLTLDQLKTWDGKSTPKGLEALAGIMGL